MIRRHPKPILKRKGAHVSTDDNLDDRDPAWENSGWGEAACEYHGARSKAPNGPRTGVADLVDSLARKKCTEYDLVRGQHAEALGIRKSTLDREVAARRKELEQHELELPAHWHVVMLDQEVDGAELLDQIRSVFRRYIVLPPGADIALALWVLHAWTHEVCEISPILCLQSPTKRCVKTNVMILVHYLAPRSELAANVSTASIFRYIEAMHPTLLIDEADSFLSDNDEMRGILNAGHTKAGSGVIRVEEVNGSHVAKRYSTWAPKAIALIKTCRTRWLIGRSPYTSCASRRAPWCSGCASGIAASSRRCEAGQPDGRTIIRTRCRIPIPRSPTACTTAPLTTGVRY